MPTPEKPVTHEDFDPNTESSIDTSSLEVELLRIVNIIGLKQLESGSPKISTVLSAEDFLLLAHMLPESVEIRYLRSDEDRKDGGPRALLEILWDDGTRRTIDVGVIRDEFKLVIFDAALFVTYEDEE